MNFKEVFNLRIFFNKKFLLVLPFLIGAMLFLPGGMAEADCDVPGCRKPLGGSICTSKSSWTGCRHFTLGIPHYEYRELSGTVCTCGGGWPPGTECVRGWEQFWPEECGGCCWEPGASPEQYWFSGLVWASDTGSQRWSKNCPTGFNGVDVTCSTSNCGTNWDCADGAGGHWNVLGPPETLQISLSKNPNYDSCKWHTYFVPSGASTGESGTNCSAQASMPSASWQKGLIFVMQKCGPKNCDFTFQSDNNIADGINDIWCTSNDYQDCKFSHSGEGEVAGQPNPFWMWDGAICGANESSVLWGEREVYVDNINNYALQARVQIDDNSWVYIEKLGNPLASVSAANCKGFDACANCGISACADAWAHYSVYLPEDSYYIMNVHLKHDLGCDSDELLYNFYFDIDDPDFYEYPAKRGDDSWEWAIIDIGYRTAGTYDFGFALDHDCCCSPDDLNAYVSDTTIHGVAVDGFTFVKHVPGLQRGCCGWTDWVDVTDEFQTGWNVIRFKAEDTCSGGRLFNFDLDVTKTVCPCGACIPCGCGTEVACLPSDQNLASNKSQKTDIFFIDTNVLKNPFNGLTRNLTASIVNWGKSAFKLLSVFEN